MRRCIALAGLLLLTAGVALAQDKDYPTVETAPAFMYVRINPGMGQSGFNCAGGGGTIAYNLTSMFGVAADLGGCKVLDLQQGISSSLFTYVFGPRVTFRNLGKFRPFLLVNFGGSRISISGNSCSDARVKPEGTVCTNGSYSVNAFAMTAGGGFDYQLTKKISLRPVQAEYYYTRFGNNVFNNVNQNNFRLKSGIVIAWGGGM